MKSCYDFDSDQDWYDYLDSLTAPKDDHDREPDEPEAEYHEEDDRNYPANDSRWERW